MWADMLIHDRGPALHALALPYALLLLVNVVEARKDNLINFD